MPNVIKFEDLPVEAVTEACKEAYEETSWAFERAIDKAINFGRLLCIAKSKVPHGGWSKWVTETFENQASLRSIQRFMQVAESNATNPSLLEGVKTLDEALGLIQVKRAAEQPDEPRDIASEVAAECGVTREQIIRDGEYAEAVDAVATVKPVAETPAKPKTVKDIENALLGFLKPNKSHCLLDVAKACIDLMSPQTRIDWLSSQMVKLSKEDREAVLSDVETRLEPAEKATAKRGTTEDVRGPIRDWVFAELERQKQRPTSTETSVETAVGTYSQEAVEELCQSLMDKLGWKRADKWKKS